MSKAKKIVATFFLCFALFAPTAIPQVEAFASIIRFLMKLGDDAEVIKKAPAPSTGRQLEDNFESIRDDPQRSIKGENSTNAPLSFKNVNRYKGTFSEDAKTPQLLVAMPTNELQYKNIYNKDFVSGGSLFEINKFSKQLRKTFGSTNFNGGVSDLLASLENSNGSPVVVFAHSEDLGRTIVLPNGEKLKDQAVHEHCFKFGKVCVVLTCYGDDFSLTDKISAENALSMWNYAQQTMKHTNSSNVKISNADYIYLMAEKHFKTERENKAKILFSASGSVGGISYYYSTGDP